MARWRTTLWIVLFGLAAPPLWAADQLEKEPNHIYICTFNVYKLGSVAEKYDSLEDEEEEDATSEWGTPDRIKNLAKVLAVGEFDLIALQEVTSGQRGEWAVTDLARELRTVHKVEYRHFLSDHIGQGLMPEAIAFLYQASVVEPQLLTGRPTMVENIEIPGRDLVRTQWKAGDFDFTAISAHLAWGNEDHRDAGYRKIEQILTTPAPSQFSFDPDIIVLGDFNRFGAGYDSVKELDYDPQKFLAPNVTIFDPDFNIRKSVTKKSVLGKEIPDDDPQWLSTTVATNRMVYDIVFLSGDAKEEYPGTATESEYGKDFGIIHFDEAGGFGFQKGANHLSHNALKTAYSDHRPLWIRFQTNAGENDDPPVGLEPIPESESRFVATRSGRRFHRPGCSTIQGRAIEYKWTSREEAAEHRGPCGVCNP